VTPDIPLSTFKLFTFYSQDATKPRRGEIFIDFQDNRTKPRRGDTNGQLYNSKRNRNKEFAYILHVAKGSWGEVRSMLVLAKQPGKIAEKDV
jgi:hypothetical protein